MAENIFQRFGLRKNSGLKDFPSTGVYHFLREQEGERVRLHLRVDPDKTGLLIINAAQILHLNPSAVLMAWLYLQDSSEKDAIQNIKNALQHRYHPGTSGLHTACQPGGAGHPP